MRMGGAPMLSGGGLLLLIVVSFIFGVNPLALLEQVGPMTQIEEPTGEPGAEPTDELGQFVSVVLADTEDTWNEVFRSMGRSYEEPSLVLFSQMVRSACGMAQSAMGPFYCPLDGKVYIDLSFYRDLRDRFGAPGDFAQAYVIAHEVGHHVQNLLGISGQVQQAQQRGGQREANALSVRLELQADCFAGVWAHHADRARDLLEQGDVEEGLNAASAIGDDRLQRQSQGTVVPESFTHGSAEQRVRWFERGIRGGTLDTCNTFDAPEL
jgi:predicted metalloprotease